MSDVKRHFTMCENMHMQKWRFCLRATALRYRFLESSVDVKV